MITSRSNPKIIDTIKLRKKSTRYKRGEYLIEGTKLFFEAQDNDVPIKEVFATKEWLEKNGDRLETSDIEIVEEPVIEKLSTQVTPDGVVAVLKMREMSLDYDLNSIYLDNIRDPGNLGTIIRTAEAAGYKQILLSKNCVDPYNEKVLRGSMGSLFRTDVNIVEDSILETFKNNGFEIIATDLDGEVLNLKKLQIPEKFILVFGNESNGINESIRNYCTQFVKIPIYGKAESLNVSVAAGIIMYAYINV